ncbi:EF-TU receptor [Actinidia rufa]|uniref:non-specific serine/threonine protein kinase n=1 Tax=Actinidia rufa TaxID=165716 RepID=A0A7J0E112_9ERIC|nr:EF-TU receptor [Actinidia rufa]
MDGFSQDNLLGIGGFGSVYERILDQGERVVAVKLLNLQSRAVSKSFIAESLVYESGCIQMRTKLRSGGFKELNFLERLNIAIDVACALDYLHRYVLEPIVHCDLKPTNILLDNEMTGHGGDFGMARLLPVATDIDTSANQSSSIVIRGTTGYAAPEYGIGSEVSTSGDVYSYGILLLEMFTQKRPTNSMFGNSLTLHNYVNIALLEQVASIVDPTLFRGGETGETY